MGGEQEKAPKAREKRVYVIGGGIAGLTAAHELVERGFEVTVVEKLARPFDYESCEVGGLARTQWCAAYPADVSRPVRNTVQAESMMGSSASLGAILRREISFGYRWGYWRPEEHLFGLGGLKDVDALANDLGDYLKSRVASSGADPTRPLRVGVEGYTPSGQEDMIVDPPGTPRMFELADLEKALTDGQVAPDLIKYYLGTGPAPTLPGAGPSVPPFFTFLLRPVQEGDTPSQRLSRFRAILVTALLDTRLVSMRSHLTLTPRGLGGVPRLYADEPQQAAVVRLRHEEVLMPGEHGYRYFPGFYRHTFDTMKRIPVFEAPAAPRLLDQRRLTESLSVLPARNKDADYDSLAAAASIVESSRTVYDNIIPTLQFAVATGDNRAPTPISRLRPRSFLEIRTLLTISMQRLGVNLRDGLRFQLKLAQYMTSSRERRKTYESTTWSEFLSADKCTPRFRELIERWPQALVGLRASLADARTIGTVTVQLLLDQLATSGFRDGTLNGPTSRAWFDPWKQFLEARGVRFVQGEMTSLTLEDGQIRLEPPSVIGLFPPKVLRCYCYVVLAVPPLQARSLVQKLWDSCSPQDKEKFPRSLLPLLTWHLPAPGGRGGLPVDRSTPSGALRHYGGIQFYLTSDLGPAQGHIYFARSEWQLSAISQAQFWQHRFLQASPSRSSRPVVGILSVDIGDWHAPAKRLDGKCAVECTRDELADEVWRQIVEGIAHDGWSPPRPFAYHIDDDMLYRPEGADAKERPVENLSPYLVNLAGDWDNHPGLEEGRAYELFEGVVLAGAYVKTRTRLTTMESANESARRAVNAILDDFRRTHPDEVPDQCQLWDPEENEIDDLQFLKDVDAKLMEQGLPHLLEILEVEKLLDGDLEVLTPSAILDALVGDPGMAGSIAGLPLKMIRRALEALFG